MFKKSEYHLQTYLLSIAVNTLFILYIFSNLTELQINGYFNSDCLYFPSIYKDIFVDHNTVQDWYLSPAPGFFPDMFFYFILMAIFKNFVVVSFLFALIQYNVLLLLIRQLFSTLSSAIPLTYLSVANLCMTLFFMVTSIQGDFTFTFYLINNAFHFGAFIMCLLCLILTFSYLKSQSIKKIIALLFLGTIAVASDRLFIVLYVLPTVCLCIAMISKQNIKPLAYVFLTNVLLVAGGLKVFDLIQNSGVVFIPEPHRIFDYANIVDSYKILHEQFGIYLTEWSVKTIILLLTIVSFVIILVMSAINFYKYRTEKINKNISDWLLPSYFIYSVFFMLIVFWAPVLNGNYTGFDTIRYNIYVLYMGVFNWGIILYSFFKINRSMSIATTAVSIAFLLTLVVQFNREKGICGLKRFVNHYPVKVAAIDNIADEYHLKYGVAGYWDAKFITMFSKKNLRVYAVYAEMTPYYHATNCNWFYDKDFSSYKPVFNFVVLDQIQDKTYFIKNFGENTQRLNTDFIEVRKVFNFKFDKLTNLAVKQ